jgi:hypothetical protein
MKTRSPSRALLRPALLLPLLSVACDPNPPPTTPDLPQVGIILDEPSTVAPSFKLGITVSGCEQVRSLELLDDNTLIKQVTYTTNPTPVEVAMNEFRYTRGLATPLALTARATCSDGRTNVSKAELATFFPVAESISPLTTNEQVVTDYFVAEGSGSTVTFIGCVRESNGSGLYKVTKNPADNAVRVTMEIPCSEKTIITERRPAGTGYRWVWTPNEGLFSLDAQFRPGPVIRVKVDRLTVTPEGDAIVYDEGDDPFTPKQLRRYSPTATFDKPTWGPKGIGLGNGTGTGSFIIGDMVFAGSGTTAVVPLGNSFKEDTPGGEVRVATLNYATGQWLSDVLVDTLTNFTTTEDLPPPVALNAAGTQLYIAVQTGTGANVKACAVNGATQGCDAPNLQWRTSAPLQGWMVALVPYASGSRVAAVAANHTWFLNATNGQVVNKGGQSISPTGALVPRQVLVGPDSVFYSFNSVVPQPGQTILPAPVEIVATDVAEKGELYRYQLSGGSLSGSTDDSGTLWLRVNRKLVRPLSPAQYRQVRP